MADALARKEIGCYGALALPLAFAGMPLYIHAPDFYAAQVGLPLSVMGIALLALRFVDALQDPLLGRFSDRLGSKRLAFMWLSALMMAAGFAALFQPLSSAPLMWFAASMLLATLGFSALAIQLNTVGALWRRDSYEKTRITSAREALGLVGLLVAVVLPAMLQQFFTPQTAFSIMSVCLVVLILGAMLLFSRWYRGASLQSYQPSEERPPLRVVLRQLPAVTRRFYLIYFLSMLASSMPALLILFFVRDRLEAEALTGAFLAIYFIMGAACMPLWQRVSRRHGKLRAWCFSMMLAVAVFVWASLLGAGDSIQFAIICALSGMAFGADLALPPSILADHIDWHGTQHSASLQFGLLTFLLKAALAAASVVVFPLLDVAGFVPAAPNNARGLFMLSVTYAAIPCVIKAASAILLWRWEPLLNQGDCDDQTTHTYHGDHAHA